MFISCIQVLLIHHASTPKHVVGGNEQMATGCGQVQNGFLELLITSTYQRGSSRSGKFRRNGRNS